MSQSPRVDPISAPGCLIGAGPVLSAEAQLSPSIQPATGAALAAYELKFLIDPADACRVEEWANRNMRLDIYSNPTLGGYQTTTLYFDTGGRDMYFRNPGYRKHKFRLRRYGSGQRVFLERKSRRGDRVEKRRSDVMLDDLPGLASHLALENSPGAWFMEKTVAARLVPACRLTYDRTAYAAVTDAGPLRLTLDRNIRGVQEKGWDLTPIADPRPTILPGRVVCEFKFRGQLPGQFKEVIERLNLTPGGVSKYRRVMAAASDPGSDGYA